MSGPVTDQDALTDATAEGVIYIDAPLPATVLNEAYRMHAEWQQRQPRVVTDQDALTDFERLLGQWQRGEVPVDVVLARVAQVTADRDQWHAEAERSLAGCFAAERERDALVEKIRALADMGVREHWSPDDWRAGLRAVLPSTGEPRPCVSGRHNLVDEACACSGI